MTAANPQIKEFVKVKYRWMCKMYDPKIHVMQLKIILWVSNIKIKIVISCISITRIRKFVICKWETEAWPWSIHKLKDGVKTIGSAVKSNIPWEYPMIWLACLIILWPSSWFIYIYDAVFNNFYIELNISVAEFSKIDWIQIHNYSLCRLRIT